jgi:hypothetical protein
VRGGKKDGWGGKIQAKTLRESVPRPLEFTLNAVYQIETLILDKVIVKVEA